MRGCAGLVVLVLAGCLCLGPAAVAAEPRNRCERQVHDYVRERLGTQVSSIYMVLEGRVGANRPTYWVTTDSCSGTYLFRMNVTEEACAAAAYGREPNYISGVSTSGDCGMP